MEKYRIVSVFYTTQPDTVGNANRLLRLKFLEDNFSLIVLSNQKEFLQNHLFKSQIISIPKINIFYLNKIAFWLIAGLRIIVIKFDLLFLFFPEAPIAFFKKGKPFICHIHQSHEIIGISNKKRGIISKIFTEFILSGIQKADFSFTVSEQLKSFFINKGIDEFKIEYLPHGVDLGLFNPHKTKDSALLDHIPKEKFVMVYTGWIGENRGLYLILDGLIKLKDQTDKIHLVLVGCEDSDIKKINEYTIENKIKESVSLFGRLDYKEMPKILKRANVCLSFLEPNESYSMSPPQKIFEYFAMGKPVIANDIPTHTDYIKNNYNGYIISKLNAALFKDVVLNLIENKEKYVKMCENALEYSRNYDIIKVENCLAERINIMLSKEYNGYICLYYY